MAGHGPPPKHPSIRSRQNKKRARVELRAQPAFRPPELPDRGPQQTAWHWLTAQWWEWLWRSPIADEFLEIDAAGLLRLAELIDLFNHGDATVHSEIRLYEAKYGLTPMDRLRLEWDVLRPAGKADEEAIPEVPKKSPRKRKPSAIDPRKVLSFERSS